jgi:hypothetical protein
VRQHQPPKVGERVQWTDLRGRHEGVVSRVAPSELLVRVELVEPVDEWVWLPASGLYGLSVAGLAPPGVGDEAGGQQEAQGQEERADGQPGHVSGVVEDVQAAEQEDRRG